MAKIFKIIFYGLVLILFSSNLSNAETLKRQEMATLAGGCFWCTESVFQQVKGVVSVEPGYSGGFSNNPTYEEVSSGNTGHAEVVQLIFEPKVISYEKVLEIFWKTHNPTTVNRQGADVGSQYRSVVFYHNKKQKNIAETLKLKLQKSEFWGKEPVVTEIVPYIRFFKAESYHKDYFNKHPDQAYCVNVIAPKINKFKKNFRNFLKEIK